MGRTRASTGNHGQDARRRTAVRVRGDSKTHLRTNTPSLERRRKSTDGVPAAEREGFCCHERRIRRIRSRAGRQLDVRDDEFCEESCGEQPRVCRIQIRHACEANAQLRRL